MSKYSFKGGIHPLENKHYTEDIEFTALSVPQTCYIPLQQHLGKPAKPVVNVGDMVEEGQLIGEADGFISANIHSSVPGKVVEIGEYPTIYSKRGNCVVIEAQGEFSKSGREIQKKDWKDLSKEDLHNIVKEAGIVGMGGAAFPTSVKLAPPKEKNVDTLIINGSECEPYLTVDDMLMRTFPEDIIEGIKIAAKILGVDKAYIGIESNKPKAISQLESKLSGTPDNNNIKVIPLKTKYPQGAEKQLIYSILTREVPSGDLPMDAGVVVQNVGTVFAIREAVVLGKALFERYLTVTGKIIKKPGNYKIRIGSRISDIVEECGGFTEDPAKIIMGGPMCGLSLSNLDIPTVKGTSGILFLAKDEVNKDDYSPCIRCGRCVSICPSGLLPCDISLAAENNRLDILDEQNIFDCIVCSACTFVCPSRRPLSHFIKLAQDKVRKSKSA